MKQPIRIQLLVNIERGAEESFDALEKRLEHEARLWLDGLGVFDDPDIEQIVVEPGWWKPGESD